jgi:hypothetical protein
LAGVKRPERDADYADLSVAEFKNARLYVAPLHLYVLNNTSNNQSKEELPLLSNLL